MRGRDRDLFVRATIPKLNTLFRVGHGNRDAVGRDRRKARKLPFVLESMLFLAGLRIPGDERIPVEPNDQFPRIREIHIPRRNIHGFADWYSSCRVPHLGDTVMLRPGTYSQQRLMVDADENDMVPRAGRLSELGVPNRTVDEFSGRSVPESKPAVRATRH